MVETEKLLERLLDEKKLSYCQDCGSCTEAARWRRHSQISTTREDSYRESHRTSQGY
jgi:NMD protein affecting ribosome stability and mRNA decay